MPLPTSQETTAINPGLERTDMSIATTGVPAFDRLMSAFDQGVIRGQDLIDLGMLKPRQRALQAQQLDSQRNDLLDKEEIRPLQKQVVKDDLNFQVQNAPAKQKLFDMNLNKAEDAEKMRTELFHPQLELNRLTMEDQIRAAKLIKSDPTGARASAIQMYLQSTGRSKLPTVVDPEAGTPVIDPSTGDAEIDWDKIDKNNDVYVKQLQRLMALKVMPIKTVEGNTTDAKGGKKKTVTTYQETTAGPVQVGDSLEVGSEPPPGELPPEPKEITQAAKEWNDKGVGNRLQIMDENYNKIASSAVSPKHTNASDMGILFSWLKILHPDSAVRQEQFKTYMDQGVGVPTQIQKMYHRLTGKPDAVLTDQERKDILDSSREEFAGVARSANGQIDFLRKFWGKRGVDIEDNIVPKSEIETATKAKQLFDQNAAAVQTNNAAQAAAIKLKYKSGQISREDAINQLNALGIK